jgi:hypothetical protein
MDLQGPKTLPQSHSWIWISGKPASSITNNISNNRTINKGNKAIIASTISVEQQKLNYREKLDSLDTVTESKHLIVSTV